MIVFTIGYGDRSTKEFISLLQSHQIRILVDVRSVPFSRQNPPFSTEPLRTLLSSAKIEYAFMGKSLGGRPVDSSCYVDGKVSYAEVRNKIFYQDGIRTLVQILSRGNVAMLCSERKPEACHRTKLIGETLATLGIEVIHIDETSSVKTHIEVISRLLEGQQSLFETTSFTSRNRYLNK